MHEHSIRLLSLALLSAVEAERQRLMSDVLVGLSSTPKWLAVITTMRRGAPLRCHL
ncbi:MAG: hypothetical protein R3F65_21515 [bacterium]